MKTRSSYGALFGIGLLVTQSWGCAHEDGREICAASSTQGGAFYAPLVIEEKQASLVGGRSRNAAWDTQKSKESPLSEGEEEPQQEDLASVLIQMGAVPQEMFEEIAVLGMLREEQHVELCRQWVPSYLKHDTSALSALSLDILKEEPHISIPVFEDDGSRTARFLDPGYSAGGISYMLSRCLAHMSALPDTLGRVPQVFVPGCGHGYDLWKMALLGSVLGVENHPALVNKKLKLNIPGQVALKAAPYLPKEVKVRDRVKLLEADVVYALQDKRYEGFFDVGYGSNFIHCLAPANAKTYARVLFSAMKKGGVVFESAHLPLTQAFHFYQRNIAQAKEFPGYILENMMIDSARVTSSHKFVMLDEVREQVPPVELRFGHYRKGDKRKLSQKIRARTQGGSEFYHRSIVGYDAKTLLTLMTQAGFVMDDLFYIRSDSSRVEVASVSADGTLSNKEQLEVLARVCFIGHKP
ncbi:MAG: hypothetical protein ACK5TR_01315 [Alphaproteobacteria bacterium]|jgi:hypothetical protein|nr:TPMT family class I SAM-dependent methyltransferase [Alphaproteobacteria bacterium]